MGSDLLPAKSQTQDGKGGLEDGRAAANIHGRDAEHDAARNESAALNGNVAHGPTIAHRPDRVQKNNLMTWITISVRGRRRSALE